MKAWNEISKAPRRIIDMHCDTILDSWEHPEHSLYDSDISINLIKLAEGGSLAQCFAMWTPWEGKKEPYPMLLSIHENYLKQMAANQAYVRQATSVAEIEKNLEEGYLNAFLTIEDSAYIEEHLERIDEAYGWGVRMMGVIWNYENSLGYPNNWDPDIAAKGLKETGKKAIARMKELGVLVDVSHLNVGGFYDVAKILKSPFVASHSCARALCDHPRNLYDDQLKILADLGGVCGINFYGYFLNQDGTPPTFQRIIDHMLYIKNKAGIDTVGLGSDFDGMEDNGELVDFRGFLPLLEAMEKYFTDDEIDKINHLNALRVIKEVVG